MDWRNESIRHLEYLIAAVEYENFTLAAESLDVTPRAVTKTLTDLKSTLKFELFEKIDGRLRPTANALRLAEEAKKTVRSNKELMAYAKTLSSSDICDTGFEGSLVLFVASSPYEGEALSKRLLDGFRNTYQKIEVTVYPGSNGTCVSAIQDESVDAAVVFSPVSANNVVCTQLYSTELCAVVSAKHPLAQRQHVTFEELSYYPVGRPYDVGACYSLIAQCFAEREIEVVFNDPMIFPNEHYDFIHEKMGIGFALSRSSIAAVHSEIVFVPFSKRDSLELPIYFIYKNLSESLALFHRFFAE